MLEDSDSCHFTVVLYLRDCYNSVRMFIFIHGRMSRSSCPCVCPVHQVIVHEVPGQELEVEVYDKDPDQDDFLGRYICIFMSLVSPFICHLSRPVGKRVHNLLSML